ncbi:hypothetical protein K438DRAFT_1728295 [Mycena galopus ATCC 62051]|nr:hypothetical protein K438DRAFT_1728295 [Mycena galopus ATCC 62051]
MESHIRKPGKCCPPSVLNSILRTKRTAEGCAWGHSLDNFFCAKADAENYTWNDVWTTSVLEELGAMNSSEVLAVREPRMRARKPWPVLRIPRGADTFPSLGDPDPGSDHEPEDEIPSRGGVSASAPEPPMPSSLDIDPFQVDDFPKLEEFIPPQYLPRFLCVHDSDSRLSGTQSTTDTIHYYKRTYPQPDSGIEENGSSNQYNSRDEQHLGHLYLTRQSRIGCGHHSNVYRSSLKLPTLDTGATRHVAVVAKIAVPRREAREFLHHEATTYDSFPEHLAQEFCGYALVPGIKYPVPVGAVVPKFFGYYIPEHPGYSVGDITEPSPILLLEECGEPVDPRILSHDNKAECFSMFLRLHLSGFLQKSAFKKNILVQPGPLTVPPQTRSLHSPSFRVIDFGRALHRPAMNQKEWQDEREAEAKDVQKVLLIPRHSMC